ncbi:MAG: globin family protein [Aggregatilineales bacterium]
MTLTDTQKQLVTESFGKVESIAEQAAGLFYNRLWEIAPETKALFSDTNMRQQGIKLMQTLKVAVGALNDLDALVPVVYNLGKRHINYGVTKEHYAIVGEALLWTLGQGLGEAFTPEVEEAWTEVYGVVASVATSAYDEQDQPKAV